MFIYILFVTNHITSLEKRIKYQYDSLWFNKLKIHGLSMAQSHLTVLQIVGTMDMNSSSRSHSRQLPKCMCFCLKKLTPASKRRLKKSFVVVLTILQKQNFFFRFFSRRQFYSQRIGRKEKITVL